MVQLQGRAYRSGRENAKNYLADNPAVFDEVEQAVREKCLARDDEDALQQTAPAGANTDEE